MKRFNLKKLNDVEVREQYQVKTSNKYAALENLNDDVEINRVWESNAILKASATGGLGYKLKHYKPWFD
jgi:hypothetical protein